MWMLLQQPNMDFDDIEHPTDVKIDWNESDDIPKEWRSTVERCMEVAPNLTTWFGEPAFPRSVLVECNFM
jgi:hypothetical protein